jgi:hypothetical protein
MKPCQIIMYLASIGFVFLGILSIKEPDKYAPKLVDATTTLIAGVLALSIPKSTP